MNEGYQRYKVLWPLVPAMAMVMIDFTIVSISATTIQWDVHLTETGERHCDLDHSDVDSARSGAWPAIRCLRR